MVILIYAYSMIMRKVRLLNKKMEKHRAVLKLTSNGSTKTSSYRGKFILKHNQVYLLIKNLYFIRFWTRDKSI